MSGTVRLRWLPSGALSSQGADRPHIERRTLALSLLLASAVMVLAPLRLVGAEPSGEPGVPSSPPATLAPAEALCESVGDLRLIVAFLQGIDVAEDGWVPVFVGVVAGLSEARQLAGTLGDTYRPLVEDLVASLETAEATLRELRESASVGAGVAAVGEAIADIGYAMDALSAQVGAPCPTDAPSGAEAPSATEAPAG